MVPGKLHHRYPSSPNRLEWMLVLDSRKNFINTIHESLICTPEIMKTIIAQIALWI